VRRPVALAIAVLTLAAAVIASSATAGPPGSWTRVTDKNGRNIDQVGLARTGDGVLHVAWKRRNGPTNDGIRHTPISPAGKVGSAGVVLDGFKSAGDPDVVATPDGKLRVFFNGLGDTVDAAGVVSATAPASGGAWKREGVRVSSITSALDSVGAAVTGAGQPVFSYTRSFAVGFHVGLDPAVTDTQVQPDKQCCDYMADLATDAKGGQTLIGWYSNAKGREGTWVQQVLPGGGQRRLVPGSVSGGSAIGVDQRVAISGRIGAPGVYVGACGGYPTCKRALLWRVGAGAAMTAGTGNDVEDVHVSAGPQGRLWVAWHDGATGLRAVRTNKAATRVGPVIEITPPAGASYTWKVTGEGSRGPLDLLVSVTTPGSLATWHTQVLPRLSLSAKKGATSVTFTVTDAGDPVAGAKVSFLGKTIVTTANGRAVTGLPGKTAKATAAKAGYASASTAVKG
jgi:hypothetical protein